MLIRRPINHGVLGSWLAVCAIIPMMSLFGSALRHLLSDILVGTAYTLFMGGALIAASAASLFWIMRKGNRRNLWHGLWLLLVLGVITQVVPNVTEWLHFVLFGLFGVLATLIWYRITALLLFLAMSIGDEVFQWFLPDRVGDPRDVLMNFAACMLGAAVALIGGEET